MGLYTGIDLRGAYDDGYRDGMHRREREVEGLRLKLKASRARYEALLRRVVEADSLNTQPRVIVLEPK